MSPGSAAVAAVLGLAAGPLANRVIDRWVGERTRLRRRTIVGVVAALWAATGAIYGLSWILPALLVLVWALVVGTVIDLDQRIIPNRLTLPLPLLLAVLLVVPAALEAQWRALVVGLVVAVAVPAAMLVLSELMRLVRGQAGIGMGDIKLLVSIGLVVGYLGGWHVMVFLYASAITAVVAAFGLMAAGRAKLATRIPYGPYLALGALAAVLGDGPLAEALARLLVG